MRNKTRFDYVDEFRKINTLQKLIPMQSLFIDDQQDGKQQNNKFIRYKDEWILEQQLKNQQQIFLNNPIIASYKQDLETESLNQFDNKINKISKDINYYQNWSQVLNNDIKTRDYKHKFKYLEKVAPPPRLKEELDPNSTLQIGDDKMEDKAKQSKEDTNIELPKRGKYNFDDITEHIYSKQYTKNGKQNDTMRDLTIKNQIMELRKLKNLAQIQKIGDFYSEFNKFNYYIQPKPDLCDIDFVDNSIILSSNNLSFDYFRDIGMPSRNIMQYTMRNAKKLKIKGEDDGMDLLQAYSDQKRQLIYLYFLKDEQLKINKNDMTFFDMANISTGRITSGNAHMCIRSEKVTLQQYDKLLRKMQKYDLRQNQTGQPKIDTGVGDQDTDDLNFTMKGEQEQQRDDDNLNIEKIIQQINQIRKEVKTLNNPNSTNIFHANNFNDQVYIKMERLLNRLFDIVVEKFRVKYTIDQIRDHIHEIDGKSQSGYDKLRVLWFIVNVYDQLMNKQQKTVNLRGIAFQKANAIPQIVKYKGKKSTIETIQPKKVYGFNYKRTEKDTDKTPNKNKSPVWRSTLNKTPVKWENTIANKTPKKGQGNTNSKPNSTKWITTEKKPPQTAHK